MLHSQQPSHAQPKSHAQILARFCLRMLVRLCAVAAAAMLPVYVLGSVVAVSVVRGALSGSWHLYLCYFCRTAVLMGSK